MKKLLIIGSVLCLFAEGAIAQAKFPQQSVKGSIEQVVGLTDVEVNYTRPAKRGRTIFGNLVPYNQHWRTGANENTTIAFNDDVTIGGKHLPKGKYALYTKPAKGKWTFYFYKKNDNWGLPQSWDDAQVALEAEGKAVNSPTEAEYLTIQITPIDYNNGKITVHWDKTIAELPFKVRTQEQATESIKAASSAREYYEAASYLLNSNGDMQKANELINKSISMQTEVPYYITRIQALILAKLGKTKEAISVAETALQKAQSAGNQEYVKMLQESISGWKKKTK